MGVTTPLLRYKTSYQITSLEDEISLNLSLVHFPMRIYLEEVGEPLKDEDHKH